ncbi:MAG: GrpB family protein [Desulfobacterales bacterium]|nr:GrpB family protein [Desulfobacterales bacterium]
MPKDLNKLSREELGRLFPVLLSEYRPEWPVLFEKEKAHIQDCLGDCLQFRIVHIGSTAVPGLTAKPTIDILVEIPGDEDAETQIIRRMTAGGYQHVADHRDHLMMVQGYTPEGFNGQCIHVHMAPAARIDLWQRIRFRDYLIAHPEVAAEYAELKRGLAVEFRYDRDAYTAAKTEFVTRVTQLALSSGPDR